MTPLKQYMAGQMVGKTFRFKCDCLMAFDITGQIVDFEVKENEIIFSVSSQGKLIPIGSNHPKMFIEPV